MFQSHQLPVARKSWTFFQPSLAKFFIPVLFHMVHKSFSCGIVLVGFCSAKKQATDLADINASLYFTQFNGLYLNSNRTDNTILNIVEGRLWLGNNLLEQSRSKLKSAHFISSSYLDNDELCHFMTPLWIQDNMFLSEWDNCPKNLN